MRAKCGPLICEVAARCCCQAAPMAFRNKCNGLRSDWNNHSTWLGLVHNTQAEYALVKHCLLMEPYYWAVFAARNTNRLPLGNISPDMVTTSQRMLRRYVNYVERCCSWVAEDAYVMDYDEDNANCGIQDT